jgi:CrcB protein
MRDLLLVAFGGMAGAVARFGLALAATKLLGKGFAWGTLLANVLGCFLMGLVLQRLLELETAQNLSAAQNPAAQNSAAAQLQIAFWHRGIAIGFLGGLTTFSSFSADTLRHLHSGQPLTALLNIFSNLLLSLLATYLGILLYQSLR